MPFWPLYKESKQKWTWRADLKKWKLVWRLVCSTITPITNNCEDTILPLSCWSEIHLQSDLQPHDPFLSRYGWVGHFFLKSNITLKSNFWANLHLFSILRRPFFKYATTLFIHIQSAEMCIRKYPAIYCHIKDKVTAVVEAFSAVLTITWLSFKACCSTNELTNSLKLIRKSEKRLDKMNLLWNSQNHWIQLKCSRLTQDRKQR